MERGVNMKIPKVNSAVSLKFHKIVKVFKRCIAVFGFAASCPYVGWCLQSASAVVIPNHFDRFPALRSIVPGHALTVGHWWLLVAAGT